VTRPSDFPPPWSADEAIAAPTDPEDERIEVGVLVVGAGPAGLACAIRFGQLLEEHPDVAEQLGEVPLAVLDKGRQPGSHLLSGAVVNPRSLDALGLGDFPRYGPVTGESVLFLTQKGGFKIPTPPTMKNHGNVVVSVSQLGRWLAGKAEEAGAMLLPETDAQQLLVSDGRVIGIRTGDKGRGREGEELGNFEPGSDIAAQVTVLAEGTQGHLTGAALQHFELQGDNPQVWALGVKEVWKVAKPLDRIVHTMGWPLRPGRKFREFGGSFVYPMGDDHVTIGLVVGLDYRDAELSVHDLLQELKLHPRIRPILEGGERVQWGAKTIPEGGMAAFPKAFHAPGLLLAGDGVGLVNVPALKGIHYAVESGRLAAEAAFASLTGGELASYDASLKDSFLWNDLKAVRNMRQAFGRGFWLGGAIAGAATVTRGAFPLGITRTERDAEHDLISTDRAASYPTPDGQLTFDKLSSVFASGNRTRDDQPNHIRIQRRVPRDVAEMWARMCPAQVYEVGAEDGDGTVTVELQPSNCVQCGAITAKGGRLTPPEGGSGPEYTLT
jgi:electron-transferring-flavoprotein dehydrogenase